MPRRDHREKHELSYEGEKLSHMNISSRFYKLQHYIPCAYSLSQLAMELRSMYFPAEIISPLKPHWRPFAVGLNVKVAVEVETVTRILEFINQLASQKPRQYHEIWENYCTVGGEAKRANKLCSSFLHLNTYGIEILDWKGSDVNPTNKGLPLECECWIATCVLQEVRRTRNQTYSEMQSISYITKRKLQQRDASVKAVIPQ